MKRAIIFSLVFLFVSFSWFLNPAMKQAEAITQVYLTSPSDSSKMTTDTTTFRWGAVRDPGRREEIKKYHIVVAQDFELNDQVWEDSTTLHPDQSIVYDGPAFEEWETYFWSVRVQVDSITAIDTSISIDTIIVNSDTTFDSTTVYDTTFVSLWYKFVKPFAFLYTTATLIEIPDSLSLNGFPQNLQTIQVGIIWAAAGDTILVEPGVYYENLRFDKDSVILASHFARDTTKTAMLDSTIIDGDSLTRGEENGSVIYFTSEIDSTSGVIGFTIRNGRGTKVEVGTDEKFNGGGIYCELGSTPTIAYNVITGNHVPDDGGGIFCFEAAPNIFNNIITKNSAGGSGGAIQCYRSIKTRPSLSSGLTGGKEEDDDDLENSLYPRDATEVFPALSSDPLLKPAQDTPPVPVVKYYPVKQKYFLGDTIWLNGSESYDPDGDSIDEYYWEGRCYYDCNDPSKSKRATIENEKDSLAYFVVTEGQEAGIFRFKLRVRDSANRKRVWSDEFSLNVQYPPSADAGDTVGVAPGDTAWLDASGSCDVNPDDTTLSYHWTQILGPVTVTLVVDTSIIIDTTIVDSDTIIDTTVYSYPANPYFETEDDSVYLGEYQFQLEVCDSSEDTLIDITTNPPETTIIIISDCDTTIAVVMCSNAPVAVCPPDSLFGYDVGEPILLDGSLSWDPDSAIGDYISYFIWEGVTLTTCEGTLELSGIIASSQQETILWYPQKGGVYELSLSVEDSYGIRSKNTATLKISVQLPPEADAGPDTIILPGSYAYLHGSACEVNWDQVDSLKYRWFRDPMNPAPGRITPDSVSQEIKFLTGEPGVFRFFLRVTDTYLTSGWDDTVKVIINAPPKIDSITPNLGQVKFAEGDSVELIVWAHDDDAEVFGDSLTFNWTPTYWPGFPQNTHQPQIANPISDTAKFIPLKYGDYVFQVVVHDTISPQQADSVLSGFNDTTVTVRVDTSFAYPNITGNLISSNTAGSKGGGIDCSQSSPEIINNIFYKNESGSSGGAACLRFSSTPYIERNIFFGNISRDSTGGAIANLKAELSPAATIGFREKMVVATNAFWDNPGGNLYQPPGDVSGNIYVYPRLIDPDYGDFRLECSSPCLDDSIGLLLWLYPDTCSTAPPFTMISLSLFQNPVATALAHFLVNTDVPLKAPPVGYVTMGENSPAPVDFTSISSTTYRGDFVFTTSDTAHISVFASSVQEQDTSITRDFVVQLIGAGKIGKLVSQDDRLRVLFPQGAVKGNIYATCIPVSDDPQYNFEDEEKVALGEVYQVGPLLDFEKELTISFPLDGYDLSEKDKTLLSIYRYEKNGWEKQASFLDENSISARVRSLGAYRLVYDAKQEHITGIPKTYQLLQNYPNPFNPQTMIKYELPNPGHVNITVYNILGQKIKTLVDEHQEAGHRSVNWDGKDGKGKEVASGIYFYKIKTEKFEKTKKMVLLK